MLQRQDFPIFTHNPKLIYMDAASTSQKPQLVIDSSDFWYKHDNANPNRSVYALGFSASQKYEQARQEIATFFKVQPEETIFIKSATEGLNLLARGIEHLLNPGDSIVVSRLEHHSNLVPWMELARRKNCDLKIIEQKNGLIDLEDAARKIDSKTTIVAISHASNVLGTIQPVKEISKLAKHHQALVFVDGTQLAPHQRVSPWDYDCDAYVISGHKAYGPMGTGVCFIRSALDLKLEPLLYGGDMVKQVQIQTVNYQTAPFKFEGGTQNPAGAIALAQALHLLNESWPEITIHETKLKNQVYDLLAKHNYTLHSPRSAELPIISFSHPTLHSHDICSLLDESGIAVRGGMLCAEPIVSTLNPKGVVRISLGLWNNQADIEMLNQALTRIAQIKA
jgi:cysteine desulfurase/selenocysteine lyase